MIEIQVSKVGRCYLHMTDGQTVAACPNIDFDKTDCIRKVSGNKNARHFADWQHCEHHEPRFNFADDRAIEKSFEATFTA